jgi:hypothetical protein
MADWRAFLAFVVRLSFTAAVVETWAERRGRTPGPGLTMG